LKSQNEGIIPDKELRTGSIFTIILSMSCSFTKKGYPEEAALDNDRKMVDLFPII